MTAKSQTEAEKAAQKAAEDQAKRNQIEADFREDVAKAADKRAKALAKLDPASVNVAEQAWNDTKPEGEPDYNGITSTKKAQLDLVVDAVRTSGNADVVGLEDFEARVAELLVERGETPGQVAIPGQALKEEIAAEKSKSGK